MIRVNFNTYFEQGTAERLTMHLVEEHSVVDPTYIEDFLLTYRTFLSSPMVVGKKLLEWFHDPSLRDKVCWSQQYHNNGLRQMCWLLHSPYSKKVLGSIQPLGVWPCVFLLHGFCTETSFSSRSHNSSRAGWTETGNCPLIWVGEWFVCVPRNKPFNLAAASFCLPQNDQWDSD